MAFSPVECDGFDNYSVLVQRWTLSNGGSCSSTFSRHSWGQGMGYTDTIVPQIEHPQLNQVIYEFAYRRTEAVSEYVLARLGKLDIQNRYHVSVRITASGHPYITREDASNNVAAIIAGPAVGPEHVIEPVVWYWMQILATIHETSGSVRLMMNNNTWLLAENVNTLHGGYSGAPSSSNRIVDTLRFGEFPNPTTWVDDWVLQDGSTGEIQGDMVVIGKRPISAGYITEFTPNTGDNWAAVDEVAADENTTYVASDVLGERDSYIIQDITEVPESSIVLGVQQAFRHRKEEPGPRSVTAFIRVDTDEVLGEERFPSENAYLTSIETVHTVQPDGSSAWGTVGDFNALDVEIGQEVGDGFEGES